MVVVTWRQQFRHAAYTLLGGAGRPKFNQLETVTTCTYRLSLVKIGARISSYSGNRHRPPHQARFYKKKHFLGLGT